LNEHEVVNTEKIWKREYQYLSNETMRITYTRYFIVIDFAHKSRPRTHSSQSFRDPNAIYSTMSSNSEIYQCLLAWIRVELEQEVQLVPNVIRPDPLENSGVLNGVRREETI
jgi:hypothetical protein